VKRAALITFIVLLIDQVSKFAVKLNMRYGEEILIFDWFRINFVENPGMAFGLEFGGAWGKLALTLFRIIAVFGIAYYIFKLDQKKAHKGLIFAMALIFAGAIGNIIDSIFYGVIFSGSTSSHIATVFPDGGGYGSWLHGRVVDMLYFPLASGYYPDWFPFVGGDYFEFFRPVFNIADSSISIGVALIILFQKRFFKEATSQPQQSTAE
tara:strand:- start:9165 stop:9791 length:627 start_codon:yes stop_codon:yes gene_type:complete